MQDKVSREIERTGRNLLITNVVVLSLTVLMLVSGYKYWYNFFCGPFLMDNKVLSEMTKRGDSSKFYVHVKGDKTLATGVDEIETRTNKSGEVTSETRTATYLLTAVNGKALIVKAPVGTTEKAVDFEGELQDLPADENAKLAQPLEKEGLPVMPIMLDVSNFKSSGYTGLFFGGLLLIIGLWNLRKCMLWKNEPDKHPIMKELMKLGDPRQMKTKLNDELNSADVVQVGKFFMTPTWIGSKGMYDVRLTALDHLLWIYKLQTKRSINFIPTGSSFDVIIKTKEGKELRYPGGEKEIDSLVRSVAERAPWVIAGYSDDLSRTWSKNWREFLDGVEARKQEYSKKPSV